MIESLAEKIQWAPMQTEPWEHLIIDNFLPNHVFEEIVEVVEQTNTGIKEGAAKEFQTIIDTRESTEHKEFWNDWYRVFESDIITDVLRNRFKIQEKFNFMRCDIHKCEKGFRLGEHNDIKKNNKHIVSLQIYLPLDDLAHEDGVLLHDITDSSGLNDKPIDMLPNRAWIFNCGPNTFHSVPQCTRTRHSVLMKNVVVG
tara:strand:- start:4866 stop:5462 length:597 start_codon:yes stop_codon:yes gene_type:complete